MQTVKTIITDTFVEITIAQSHHAEPDQAAIVIRLPRNPAAPRGQAVLALQTEVLRQAQTAIGDEIDRIERPQSSVF